MAIEIVFVLDRSGSMSGNQQDVVGGVNTLLQQQRDAGVQATVSMFRFDSEYEAICKHIPLADAHLNEHDYVPRGMTRLNDAIGQTIDDMGKDYAEWYIKPDGVMFVIFTDGLENASTKYTANDVHERITQQEKQWNWEFVYMGAHKDAFAEAAKLGVKQSSTRGFAKTAADFTKNYGDIAAMTVAYACNNNSCELDPTDYTVADPDTTHGEEVKPA